MNIVMEMKLNILLLINSPEVGFELNLFRRNLREVLAK
jgi:hypothetical protein